MRKELEIIKIIEQYINNELNAEDKAKFETQISKSPELQKQVEKQRLLMEGVSNIGNKQKIKKAKKTYNLTKATWYGLGALAVAGAVMAGVIGYQKYISNNNTSENIKYELNENGTNEWIDADELIAPQFFNVDMNKGDVVQTEQGMIVAIPEGSLLDKNGNPVKGEVEIEIKEALDASAIMMAGLSTKSGDDLLETSGMFYVNARKDGENLTINPANPIVIEVPTDEVQGGMELYKGVRQTDGSLDWQDPKPIEQFLTPVDIHSLDFYPPAYQPKLQDLGYASEKKDWKDSVYYSFANTYKMRDVLVTQNLEGYFAYDSLVKSDKPRELNPAKVQAIWNDKFQNTLVATKEFEERMKCLHGLAQDRFLELYVSNLDKRMSAIDSMVVESIGGFEERVRTNEMAFNSQFNSNGPNGKQLFNDNCASCHKTIYASTGPPLGRAKQRWANAGEEELIYEFVNNSSALLGSGKSKRAFATFNEYSKAAMTAFPSLSTFEIDAILNFADSEYDSQESLYADSLAQIDAKAVALDTPSEKCLPCESCDLDDLKNQFIEFALQNKGRVKMELGATQMLQAYYQKHSKIYAEAAEKVQDQFRKEYNQEQTALGNAKYDKSMQNWVRDSKNLRDEIIHNVDEVYKQLGIKHVWLPATKYTVPVTGTGWNNIDRKVIEGTIARTTINVKYKGKKAEIKYEPITINVIDESKYDKVFAYLLPKQLTSFQRIKKTGSNFMEKLNEFYNYDVVVVGYIGDQIYVGIERKVNPKDYSISLHSTDKADLKAVFHTVGKPKHKIEFIEDILDQQIMLKMETTVAKMEDMIAFREEVEKSIFRCFVGWDSTTTYSAVSSQ